MQYIILYNCGVQLLSIKQAERGDRNTMRRAVSSEEAEEEPAIRSNGNGSKIKESAHKVGIMERMFGPFKVLNNHMSYLSYGHH